MTDIRPSSPKIAVVVAVYNQQQYIGRCLRSLLRQTLSPTEYEVIVVNDGSTDLTRYALSLFEDPRHSFIRIIDCPVNKGLPSALNLGISLTSAEYIVRVDSDDYVNANFLLFLSYYLDENRLPSAVGCDYFLVDDQECVLERMDSSQFPIACGIMFRRQALLEIGLYDETMLAHEDLELRHRFEQQYHIAHLPLPLYRYRRHEQNMTNDAELMTSYYTQFMAKQGDSVGKDT